MRPWTEVKKSEKDDTEHVHNNDPGASQVQISEEVHVSYSPAEI